MTDSIQNQNITKSLRLLCDGFKNDFASFTHSDERMTTLLHDLSCEFVDNNVPLICEDHKIDLAFMLMESINIVTN